MVCPPPVEHRIQESIDKIIEDAGIHETVRLGSRLKDYLEARKERLRPETLVYLKRLAGSMEEVI
jgi:hypothetical protein